MLLAEAPAEGVTVVDLGRVGLRDFPEPEQVWQVGADALASDVPAVAQRRRARRETFPLTLTHRRASGSRSQQVC